MKTSEIVEGGVYEDIDKRRWLVLTADAHSVTAQRLIWGVVRHTRIWTLARFAMMAQRRVDVATTDAKE